MAVLSVMAFSTEAGQRSTCPSNDENAFEFTSELDDEQRPLLKYRAVSALARIAMDERVRRNWLVEVKMILRFEDGVKIGWGRLRKIPSSAIQ